MLEMLSHSLHEFTWLPHFISVNAFYWVLMSHIDLAEHAVVVLKDNNRQVDSYSLSMMNPLAILHRYLILEYEHLQQHAYHLE